MQYYGGSVSLADFCPYIQEFTWRAKNIVVRGSHCLYEENNPREFIKIKSINNFYNINFDCSFRTCEKFCS